MTTVHDTRSAPLRRIVDRIHGYGEYAEELECGHYYNGPTDRGFRGTHVIKARRCTVCLEAQGRVTR